VIDAAYLGMGSEVQAFEQELAHYLGVDDVAVVNSGTAALHLALMAAGLKPGDEVLVQSLTYVASFQAISAAGLVPIPCEVDPKTCTLDLTHAATQLSERTKAIMPVHYASRPGDLGAIYTFAKTHGLRVVEDAAHAFGNDHLGKKLGASGDIVCFSFDGIKNITSGEGGAIVSQDQTALEYVRNARLLGVKKDSQKRFQGERSWDFDVSYQGYRFHMSNLFAAIGRVQLGRFESEFKPRRQALARRYHQALNQCSDLALFPDDYAQIVPHIFPVKVLNGRRDELRQSLLDQGIETGIHYFPNHLLEFYGAGKTKLPVTENLYGQLMTLPLHTELSDSDGDKVIASLLQGVSDQYNR